MLIISKFRDYYDSCLGFGIDKKVVYNRTKVRFQINPHLPENPPKEYLAAERAFQGWGPDTRFFGLNNKTLYDVQVVGIGFAGVLYKAVLVTEYPNSDPISRTLHFTSKNLPKGTEDIEVDWRSKLTLHEAFREEVRRENVDIFKEVNAPVFLLAGRVLTLNPCLGDYGFSKFKDGVSAFQELSAFIAGAMGSVAELPTATDDKTLLESKGFDRNSFRRGPTKRRRI